MNESTSNMRHKSRRSSAVEDRRAAMWKGLPAAILAILALGTLVFASDRSNKLEQSYRRWAEDATKDRVDRTKKIINDLRVMQAGSASKTLDEMIPPEDERRVGLDSASISERLYYEKLIALNSSEPEYRYQYASALVNSRASADQQRGFLLMHALAPHNQPGYYKAHLWWTEHFSQLIKLRQINLLNGAELIFNHAENCLRRQSDDRAALLKKAEAAMLLGRNEIAQETYAILFDQEPLFYSELVVLNNRMQRAEKNEAIFRSAKGRIEMKLRDEMSADQWTNYMTALVGCMIGLNEHDEAVARLRREIANQTESGESVRRLFLDELLCKTLVNLQRVRNPNNFTFSTDDLKLIEEAYQLDPKNLDVLQILTRMVVGGDPELVEAARKVYDPYQDSTAPALILNELGTLALSKQDYETAIKYMELARQKDPNNMTALNNLAYVYLASENRNPERALKLVDDAIRLIPNPDVAKSVMTFFLDTKGTALMQLNRMPEAIAALEMALKDRPNEIKIIESLIKCYEASNLSADAYKERLSRLKDGPQSSP